MSDVTGQRNDRAYVRFVAISAGASGALIGTAAGSASVLMHSTWPLALLVVYLTLRLVAGARSLPHLVRLRRWWSMPAAALVAAALASLVSSVMALFLLAASGVGFIAWTIAYALLDVRVDPRGDHGAGWL